MRSPPVAPAAVRYRIGDHRYLDGGFRTNAENADLAAGYERVLVLSPSAGDRCVPQEWGTHLATQVDELRAADSVVETIYPDSEAEYLFGVNGMDSVAATAGRSGGVRAGHWAGSAVRRLRR